MLLGRWSARRSAFTARRNLAACPRTGPRKVRGLVGSWGSGALTLRCVGQDRCRVTLGGGIGGCGRHHDVTGLFASPPPCLCVPNLVLVRGVAWRGVANLLTHLLLLPRIYIYIFALIVRRLAAALPGGLGGWRRRFCAPTAQCWTDLGVWKAPRGAGERDLLGICGGIGRFDDHQTIAASPPPSPPV